MATQSQLDPNQILKRAFDDASDSFRVELNSGVTIGSVDLAGYTLHEFARNDYSSSNSTTAAYLQLIAATANAYEEFEIFDSSGQTLKIAFGAAGFEVDQFLVFPGGNSRVLHHCPINTRISIKAVSGNATVGEHDLNLRG